MKNPFRELSKPQRMVIATVFILCLLLIIGLNFYANITDTDEIRNETLTELAAMNDSLLLEKVTEMRKNSSAEFPGWTYDRRVSLNEAGASRFGSQMSFSRALNSDSFFGILYESNSTRLYDVDNSNNRWRFIDTLKSPGYSSMFLTHEYMLLSTSTAIEVRDLKDIRQLVKRIPLPEKFARTYVNEHWIVTGHQRFFYISVDSLKHRLADHVRKFPDNVVYAFPVKDDILLILQKRVGQKNQLYLNFYKNKLPVDVLFPRAVEDIRKEQSFRYSAVAGKNQCLVKITSTDEDDDGAIQTEYYYFNRVSKTLAQLDLSDFQPFVVDDSLLLIGQSSISNITNDKVQKIKDTGDYTLAELSPFYISRDFLNALPVFSKYAGDSTQYYFLDKRMRMNALKFLPYSNNYTTGLGVGGAKNRISLSYRDPILGLTIYNFRITPNGCEEVSPFLPDRNRIQWARIAKVEAEYHYETLATIVIAFFTIVFILAYVNVDSYTNRNKPQIKNGDSKEEGYPILERALKETLSHHRRIRSEATILLISGLSIFIIGVVVFTVYVRFVTPNQTNKTYEIWEVIVRPSFILITIEGLSFFFLRQYVNLQQEFRYYYHLYLKLSQLIAVRAEMTKHNVKVEHPLYELWIRKMLDEALVTTKSNPNEKANGSTIDALKMLQDFVEKHK